MEITEAEYSERYLELSSYMDEMAEEQERAWATAEAGRLRREAKLTSGVEARRLEAARREALAKKYRQWAVTAYHMLGGRYWTDKAKTLEADAAYLREEADRLAHQAGITDEEVREFAVSNGRSRDNVAVPAGASTEPPMPSDPSPSESAPKSGSYMSGWQDAMNDRYDAARERDWDYRRGHDDALTKQLDNLAVPAGASAADGDAEAVEDVSYWRDAYGNARVENKDLKDELAGLQAKFENAQTQLNEMEAAARRVRECPEGLPDCPQCALNRKAEEYAATGIGGLGDGVPRVGGPPAALIWESEDGNGWRVAYFNGKGHGTSHGLLSLEEAASAAERLGYGEHRRFWYPMIRGPVPEVCDYSGELRWDKDVSDYLVENCFDWRELRSSYLATARSDDEAIAAALAECSDYLDEWKGNYGSAVEAPPVYAEIKAELRRGEVNHIYARPASRGGPATACYFYPEIYSENGWFRAEVFTDDPDPSVLGWAADYWAPINGGKPPPIMIRSGERLEGRIRALRGDNTPGAVLSL